MKQVQLTTPMQNRLRWTFAAAVPTVFTLLLFLFLSMPVPTAVPVESPPMILDYTEVNTPEPARPSEPETPQRAVTASASPRQSLSEPVPSEQNLEPSPADNSPGDVQTSPVKSEPQPARSEGTGSSAPQTVSLGSAKELDNISYEPIFNPKPAYPSAARSLGITGYADVDLTIDEKGKILGFEITKSYGHPSFGDETAKVISRWRFPPPRIGGKPVRVIYQYRVWFRLND